MSSMSARLASCSLALLLVLPLLLPAPALRAEEAVVATAPAIREADLERHVGYLASEALAGRATTEAGAETAARYIAEAFARHGLEPAGLDGTWLQPYVVRKPELGEENAFVTQTDEGERAWTIEVDYNPFSVSPRKAAEGDVVFAGYGITAPGRDWDDYADLDVEGKVVLVLRKDPGWNAPRHAAFLAKLSRAAEQGAAALLLANDRATVGDGPDRIGHWSAMIGAAAGSGTIPFAFITRDVADHLLRAGGTSLAAAEDALAEGHPCSQPLDGVRARLATDIGSTDETNARNVAGYLPGRDARVRDEVVVIGAHYDHVGLGYFGSLGGPSAAGTIHPGADDNASGTSALLELAEHLARPENRPRRSVLFLAFSGEEMGLLGSQHWVAAPTLPLERIVTMVNLDMVGRSRERRLQVGGVGTGEGLRDIVAAANAEHGFAITWDEQGEAPSDSTSFFRQRIPVLFFFTGLHADYHRPSDTPDKIDYGALADVTRLVRDVVLAIGDREPRVVYTQPPPRPRPPMIGVQLSPEADPRGVRLGPVSPGGPAAQAGLEEGDVIVSLAGGIVRTRQDLVGVLRRLEAGKEVVVEVLRGEETLRLDITPAERPGRRR